MNETTNENAWVIAREDEIAAIWEASLPTGETIEIDETELPF